MKSLEFKKKVQARRCFLEVVSIDPVTGIKTLGVKRKGWVKASSQYLVSRALFVVFLLIGILRASLYICYKIITQSPDAQPISRRRGSKVVYISRSTEILKKRSEFNNKMCGLDHNPGESNHLIVYLDTVSKGLILSNLSITTLKKKKCDQNSSYSSLLTKRRRLDCDTTYNLLSTASSLSIVPKKRKFNYDPYSNLPRVVKFPLDHKRRKFDCATYRSFSPISNPVFIEKKKRKFNHYNLFSRPSDISMDTKRKKLNLNSINDTVGTSNAVTTMIKKRKLEYDNYNNLISSNDIPMKIIRLKLNI